jgi:hypothetical protein
MKIESMKSHNGNPVPNQFECSDDQGNIYFQSYKSVIVKIDKDNKVYLDAKRWDYSKTTGKYRNLFLGESRKETEAKIKNGTYTLVNLN